MKTQQRSSFLPLSFVISPAFDDVD